MATVSRRDALKLASTAGATAMLATVGTRATAEPLSSKQDDAKKVGREVGPDPHAEPDPNERHALIKVRDNLYRFEVGQGLSQHSSLLLVTDEGIILTDPIKRRRPCGCGTR